MNASGQLLCTMMSIRLTISDRLVTLHIRCLLLHSDHQLRLNYDFHGWAGLTIRNPRKNGFPFGFLLTPIPKLYPQQKRLAQTLEHGIKPLFNNETGKSTGLELGSTAGAHFEILFDLAFLGLSFHLIWQCLIECSS